MVNTISPDAGAYVAVDGRNVLTNCSPILESQRPSTSVLLYPLPAEFNATLVTLPFVTVISAVAPTPDPNLFLSDILVYTPSLYQVPGVIAPKDLISSPI